MEVYGDAAETPVWWGVKRLMDKRHRQLSTTRLPARTNRLVGDEAQVRSYECGRVNNESSLIHSMGGG